MLDGKRPTLPGTPSGHGRGTRLPSRPGNTSRAAYSSEPPQQRRGKRVILKGGWGGIQTHERRSPLPVFKVGVSGSGTARTNTPEETGSHAIEALRHGSTASGPGSEIEPDRDTTRQIETTHQASRRQGAAGLSHNDSNWRYSRGVVLARCPVWAALGSSHGGR